MPRRYTADTLRTRCMRRADKENDGHISPAEWLALMSEVYGDLFSIVVDAGARYFETTGTIVATGAASYDEFDDHMTTIGVDRITDAAGHRCPLEELTAMERHIYAGQTGDAVAYTMVDDQIFLYPTPSSGTYEMLYTPQPPDLTAYADGDQIDVVNVYGEAFLINGVAAIALSKSESDVRFCLSQQAKAGEKLLEWAAQRALINPRQSLDDDIIDRFPHSHRYPGDY